MTVLAPAITGFETRAQLRLRPPESVSRNITPGRGGVAVHYRGAGAQPSSHERCRSDWRGFQAYHMDVHGWVDIAYTVGFCSHGVVLAGRGFGTRTAANGTDDANDRFYAACWLGGEASRPTEEGLRALTWVINECRTSGGAGLAVRPHRSFKSTACPGDDLTRFAVEMDGVPIEAVQEDDMTPEQDKRLFDVEYKAKENGDKIDAIYAAVGRIQNAVTDQAAAVAPSADDIAAALIRQLGGGGRA